MQTSSGHPIDLCMDNHMIKEIMRDMDFLAEKSDTATIADLGVAEDLMDTLIANADGCVGMAANMIGVKKCIIAFDHEGEYMLMFNPQLIKCVGQYETEEGCLSLEGIRKTNRYKTIKVKYENENFQPRIKTFSQWSAQIIQHEIDHCNGIII